MARVLKHAKIGTRVLLALIPMQDVEKERLKLNLYQRLFSEMREGVMITNKNAVILDINPAFTDITDYRQIDVMGKNANILQSGRHDVLFYQSMWQSLMQRGFWEGEIWNKRKGGDIYPEWLSISALKDSSDEIEKFIAIFSDISARQEADSKIKHLAYFDGLTSLTNRASFMNQIALLTQSQMTTQPSFGLMYIDLDGFKRINDCYGHAAGDFVLKESAQRMILEVRDVDVIARLGGDEFAILVRSAHLESELMIIANRLQLAMQKPFVIDGQAEKVGASIGVLLYPDDAGDADTLLRRADDAMYVAKTEGKGRVHRWKPVASA
jgi:diguanylate cyclase (GGDEF)-like protein/PAS domain S-box-containing protein